MINNEFSNVTDTKSHVKINCVFMYQQQISRN